MVDPNPWAKSMNECSEVMIYSQRRTSCSCNGSHPRYYCCLGCMVAYTSTSRHSAIRAVTQQWICMEKRTKSRDVSSMGQFGFNGSNDGITMGICIVFKHPHHYVSLGCFARTAHHLLLVPKRYAITSTHLFADGQRYEWSRLVLPKRQPKHRIMLLRKGWGHSDHYHSEAIAATSISQQRESSKSFTLTKRNDERYAK